MAVAARRIFCIWSAVIALSACHQADNPSCTAGEAGQCASLLQSVARSHRSGQATVVEEEADNEEHFADAAQLHNVELEAERTLQDDAVQVLKARLEDSDQEELSTEKIDDLVAASTQIPTAPKLPKQHLHMRKLDVALSATSSTSTHSLASAAAPKLPKQHLHLPKIEAASSKTPAGLPDSLESSPVSLAATTSPVVATALTQAHVAESRRNEATQASSLLHRDSAVSRVPPVKVPLKAGNRTAGVLDRTRRWVVASFLGIKHRLPERLGVSGSNWLEHASTPAVIGALSFVIAVCLLLFVVVFLTVFTSSDPEDVRDVPAGGPIEKGMAGRMFGAPGDLMTGMRPLSSREPSASFSGGYFGGPRPKAKATRSKAEPNLANDAFIVSTGFADADVARHPGRNTSATAMPLSPQLVVPEECECALVLLMPPRGWRGEFGITDLRGSTVLRAGISDTAGFAAAPSMPSVSAQAVEMVVTSASAPCVTVARCRRAKDAASDSFFIFRGDSDEIFASFTCKDLGKGRLTLASGGFFDFDALDEQASARVVDDRGSLHATREPHTVGKNVIVSPDVDMHDKQFSGIGSDAAALVRIGPLGDAGLVLCGLLCLHQLSVA